MVDAVLAAAIGGAERTAEQYFIVYQHRQPRSGDARAERFYNNPLPSCPILVEDDTRMRFLLATVVDDDLIALDDQRLASAWPDAKHQRRQ